MQPINTMKKLRFKIQINSTAQNVYETMLGLKDKNTYKQWSSAFDPTSTYEGSWEKGCKILFIGEDEKGKKSGLISKIEENQPAKFVSILHYGFLDGDIEATTGEQVEKWAGAHENYSFEEINSITTLTVDIDIVEDNLEYFNKTYPKALDILKEISEQEKQ